MSIRFKFCIKNVPSFSCPYVSAWGGNVERVGHFYLFSDSSAETKPCNFKSCSLLRDASFFII